MKIQSYNIKNVFISIVDINMTTSFIDYCIRSRIYGYICVTNERTVYFAIKNKKYREIQNNSLLTIPDGIPLVWIARNLGLKKIDRVSGPDLLLKILDLSVNNKYSHYFYGSTNKTIELIKNRLKNDYQNVEILGLESPPFQPVENFNIDELAEKINNISPTFFWCGLGAPKQEYLISKLQPKLNNTICIGVGLAFEYFAGTVKRAPKWTHNIGLEGFYRLIQQPERINIDLFKRYLFWIYIIVMTKISGKKYKQKLIR